MGGFHDLATVRANFRCKYAFLLAPSSERLIENYTPYLTNMIGVYTVYTCYSGIYHGMHVVKINHVVLRTYVPVCTPEYLEGVQYYYFAEKNQEYCTCEVLVTATVVEEVHVKAGFLASSCDTLTLLIL